MVWIRQIGPDDWRAFRDIRLAALADSPSAFGSTFADAERRTDAEWKRSVRTRVGGDRSSIWMAESDGGKSIGVVAADRLEGTAETELVSMWVAPAARGAGLAVRLIETALDWAADSGSTMVSLWVTNDNAVGQRLYESTGFSVTGDHQPLTSDPCKTEIRMIRPV